MSSPDTRNCRCHNEPGYRRSDGYLRCAVKERQRQRDLYDNNPVWRITKNLKNDALKRGQTIARQREALLRGEIQK